MKPALGLLLAAAISALARATGALTRSGALAATFVGGLTYGLGGIQPSVLLLAFFASSSLLSRIGGARKRALAGDFQKSGARDHGQVLANGALASLLAAGYGLSGEPGWLVGAAGALAASNGDTWGTELGVLSPSRPRLITTGRRVAAGSSGAVSLLGSLAALAGASLIGGGAGLMLGDRATLIAVSLGGLAASGVDSLLGATVQAAYFCPGCQRATEAHPIHGCGTQTEYQRGWRWLGNDQVNLLAGAFGALASALLWVALG